MKLLRIVLLMLAGATAMVLSLMWVAQFFTGKGDVTPVIWIEDLSSDAQQSDDFAEWQDEKQ